MRISVRPRELDDDKKKLIRRATKAYNGKLPYCYTSLGIISMKLELAEVPPRLALSSHAKNIVKPLEWSRAPDWNPKRPSVRPVNTSKR
jgi:hypothetical protein